MPSDRFGLLLGGRYHFAETSNPAGAGDRFTLAYDGAACNGAPMMTAAFYYHMYAARRWTRSPLSQRSFYAPAAPAKPPLPPTSAPERAPRRARAWRACMRARRRDGHPLIHTLLLLPSLSFTPSSSSPPSHSHPLPPPLPLIHTLLLLSLSFTGTAPRWAPSRYATPRVIRCGASRVIKATCGTAQASPSTRPPSRLSACEAPTLPLAFHRPSTTLPPPFHRPSTDHRPPTSHRPFHRPSTPFD